MSDVVNLRAARKRAKRRQEDARADANRIVHGQPKRSRKLEVARREKAVRDLDRHRLGTGDGQ